MSTLFDKTGLTLSQAEREIPRLRRANKKLLAALEDLLSAGNWEERQGAEADARALITEARGK